MTKEAQKNKKNYYSMPAFEKEFFPNAFQSEIKKEQEEKVGAFGTKLATEFLEGVKRKLSK